MCVDFSGTSAVFPPGYVEEFGELVETIVGVLLYVTKYNGGGFLYEYWVEPGGRIRWVRHHANHGNSKDHPCVPHDHEWKEDENGNKREDPEWQPPNPGFPAPDSNNNKTTKTIVGAVGTVAVGYAAYAGIKWVAAFFAAPFTGGGSLIIAGVTP